jgi:hypothetical protein
LTTKERKRHIEEGFASSATRRDTVFSNAYILKARRRCVLLRRNDDGGKDVLLTKWRSRLHLLVVLRHC